MQKSEVKTTIKEFFYPVLLSVSGVFLGAIFKILVDVQKDVQEIKVNNAAMNIRVDYLEKQNLLTIKKN